MSRARAGADGMRALSLIALAWLASAAAPAIGEEADATQRARIASERSAAQAAFEQREHECQERFVVTPCVDAARRAQRDSFARLRREEAALEERQRHERAAQRAGNSAARPVAVASSAAPRSRRSAGPHEPEAPQPRAHVPKGPKVSPEEQRQTEARNAAKFEAAKLAAQQRREAVEKRNAERATSGKGAAPLPVPAAASAP